MAYLCCHVAFVIGLSQISSFFSLQILNLSSFTTIGGEYLLVIHFVMSPVLYKVSCRDHFVHLFVRLSVYQLHYAIKFYTGDTQVARKFWYLFQTMMIT